MKYENLKIHRVLNKIFKTNYWKDLDEALEEIKQLLETPRNRLITEIEKDVQAIKDVLYEQTRLRLEDFNWNPPEYLISYYLLIDKYHKNLKDFGPIQDWSESILSELKEKLDKKII